MWIANGFGEVLRSESADDLTQAVKRALSRSEDNLPLPSCPIALPEWVGKQNVKSWNALEKGARLIGVDIVNEQLTITRNSPYRTGGFVVDWEESLPLQEIEQIGRILFQSRDSDVPPAETLPRPERSKEDRIRESTAAKLAGVEACSVGERLVHTFRGTCEVVEVGSMEGVIPSVTIRFSNGEKQVLSILSRPE